MKKKRLFILTLAFLFLVSTTGFPVTYHLCRMMQEKSPSECEMCSVTVEKSASGCCAEETTDYTVSFSSDNPACCQSEFIYNKVEDDFIFSKSEINFFSSFDNIFQTVTLIPPSIDYQNEELFYCDSSPPFLINPEIYITNSVLLI